MKNTIKTILAVFFLVSLQPAMANNQDSARENMEAITNSLTKGDFFNLGYIFDLADKYYLYLEKMNKEYFIDNKHKDHIVTKEGNLSNTLIVREKHDKIKQDLVELETFINAKKAKYFLSRDLKNEYYSEPKDEKEKLDFAKGVLELGQTIESKIVESPGMSIKGAKKKG